LLRFRSESPLGAPGGFLPNLQSQICATSVHTTVHVGDFFLLSVWNQQHLRNLNCLTTVTLDLNIRDPSNLQGTCPTASLTSYFEALDSGDPTAMGDRFKQCHCRNLGHLRENSRKGTWSQGNEEWRKEGSEQRAHLIAEVDGV